MEYSITFDVDLNGMIDYFSFHNRKARWIASAVLALVFAGVIYFLCHLFAIEPALLFSAITAAVLFILCYRTLLETGKRKAAELYKDKASHEQTIHLDANGVTITTPKRTKVIDFSDLFSVHESNEYFYFYIHSDTAYFLPKSAMANEKEESAKIREILHAFIAGNQLHLK